jgi:hypothetical protein
MTILWFIIWLIEGTPDILNGNGNDTAWLVTLGVAAILDFTGSRS